MGNDGGDRRIPSGRELTRLPVAAADEQRPDGGVQRRNGVPAARPPARRRAVGAREQRTARADAERAWR